MISKAESEDFDGCVDSGRGSEASGAGWAGKSKSRGEKFSSSEGERLPSWRLKISEGVDEWR